MSHDHPSTRVIEKLKARGRKSSETLTLLHFDWPESLVALERISNCVSDLIYADEQPVIYEIIEAALSRYSDAVHFKSPNGKVEDPLRLGVFIEALITGTAKTMQVEIRHSSGQTWCLETGSSFCSWLEEVREACPKGELTIVPRPHKNEKLLRSSLYELITSEKIRNVLRRAGYEKAIVAGRLDTDS